jgi:AcrR family transcriptional regulator
VLEYSGGHRKQFYDHFESLEDCFAQAYEAWIDRLGVSLLEAAVAADSWRASVRAGMIQLLRFVVERPQIARSLFVEVQVAGGPALAKHDEAVDRLAALLDSVRTEIDPDQAPPEATGIFVVGGIEAALCDVLAAGETDRVWASLPELMHLAVGAYLSREAAEEEFEAARELIAGDRSELGGEAR